MEKSLNYISLQEAAKRCNYSQEYLSLRARQGKLKAVKIGRNWVTTKGWLDQYVENAKLNGNGSYGLVNKDRNFSDQDYSKNIPVLNLRIDTPKNIPFEDSRNSLKRNLKIPSSFLLWKVRPAFIILALTLLVASYNVFTKNVLREAYSNLKVVFNQVNISADSAARSFVFAPEKLPLILKQLPTKEEIKIITSDPYKVTKETGATFYEFFGWFFNKIQNSTQNVILGMLSLVSDVNKKIQHFGDAVDKAITRFPKNISQSFASLIDNLKDIGKKIAKPFQYLYYLVVNPQPVRNNISLVPEISPEQSSPSDDADSEKSETIKEIEVSRIVKIEPIKEIIREVITVDNESLNRIKAQLADWQSDINVLKSLSQKIQPAPAYSYAPSAPVYIGSSGVQVGGNGSFDSLGVSGSAGIGRLGVGGSTSLGSASGDKLQVSASSTFASPVTISSSLNVGGIATFDDVTIGGDITISGDLTVAGAQTYSGAASFISTSSPQLQIGYDSSNKSLFAVGSSGDLTVTATGGDISFGDENLTTTGTISSAGFTIGANALTTSEWANLDNINQTLSTTSSPTFSGLTLSGLTSGRVPYATTNGLLTDDADLTFDGTNLGLGTSPTQNQRLAISAAGAKTAADYGLYLSNTSTSSTNSINKFGLYLTSTGGWSGTSANNYGLYIDTISGGTNNYGAYLSGNVGLGDTTPDYPLEILSTSSPQFALSYTDGSAYTLFGTDSGGDLTVTPSGGDATLAGNLSTTSATLTGLAAGRIVYAGTGGLLSATNELAYNATTGTVTIGAPANEASMQLGVFDWEGLGTYYPFWRATTSDGSLIGILQSGFTIQGDSTVPVPGDNPFLSFISDDTTRETGFELSTAASVLGFTLGNLQIGGSNGFSNNNSSSRFILSGPGGVSDQRGGQIEWRRGGATGSTETTAGWAYVNANNQIVFDNAAQSSSTDSGNAYIDFDDGTTVLAQGLVTIAPPQTITFGAGGAGIDYSVLFQGESSQGTLTYMEDEAEFRFNQKTRGTTQHSVLGIEGGDALVILDADEGDDNADTWTVQSTASDNDLDFINHTSTIASLSTTGNLSTTSLTLSGLTSGRVPYATTNGLLTDDADLTFDGTDMDIGTPGSGRLSVSSSGEKSIPDYAVSISNTSTSSIAAYNKVGLYVTSTGTWSAGTAKNYGLYIDTISGGTNNYGAYVSGSVGIGDTTPDYPLEILSTSSPQFALSYTDGSAYTLFGTNSSGDLDITPSGGDVTIGGSLNAPSVSIDATSGLRMLNTAGTFYLTFANAQSSNRTLTFNSTGNYSLTLTAASSINQNVQTSASPTFVGVTLSGLTSGRVVYGTTGGQLTSDADLTFDGTNLNATAYQVGGVAGVDGTSCTSVTVAKGIVTTASGCSSDERLKTNIQNVKGVLSKLANINAVYFDWNETFRQANYMVPDDETRQIGLLAQQFEVDFPELITHQPSGYLGLRYDRLSAVLLEAIKELDMKIEDLTLQFNEDGSVGKGTEELFANNLFAASVRNVIHDLGLQIENGLAYVKELTLDRLFAKTARFERLEMIDKITGQIYCTWIENGEWFKSPGECSNSAINSESPPLDQQVPDSPEEEPPQEESSQEENEQTNKTNENDGEVPNNEENIADPQSSNGEDSAVEENTEELQTLLIQQPDEEQHVPAVE